jgi:putative glutathione S-transferase
MGLLQQGKWVDQWYDTDNSGGEFRRQDSRFRNWLTPNGEAGPNGEPGFKAEKGRYQLYVSLACPWAHRTLIFRQLKQLENIIDVSVVSPIMLDQGWTYNQSEGASDDPVNQVDFHHQLYTLSQPDYSGRVTVPVLWDKKTGQIVNNESADIIRIFNSAFNELTGNHDDYYPAALREGIDSINERVYHAINNGVYRAGFATTQHAYEKAYEELFSELDQLDQHLGSNRFLMGDTVTEADWRLFTTLIRFDAVYHGHFKCNRQRLEDFRNLPGYVRELYQSQGVADTVDFDHIKRHYYNSHRMINPTGVVPLGPEVDYLSPHGRDRALAA